MLEMFLQLIEDADVLSGWNSEGFDIPYTVNRVTKVLSKEDTRRFCLWDQYPKKREYEKFGKTAITYDLVGRVHLDSLELYRKYTYEERHTYRLDAIGEMEIGETKTVYEGTLDQLYNNDFRKFIEYNRQDTALLDKLDKKLKFLDLANTIAHENTVLLQTTLGAVAVTEQAIINEAHARGMIVPSRTKRDELGDTQAAGAYVAYPKKGLHEWIGSMDINSLYPSVIRALNMGPETIVGQLRPARTDQFIQEQMLVHKKSFAAAWEGKFGTHEYEAVMRKDKAFEITVDWENGNSDVLSAAQVYQIIFESNQPWMLSANGTIFTHEVEGVIPGLLKRWYAERKELQAKLKDAIKAENKIEEEYWDKRQLVKKINLNSLYGAILNAGCRFFDKRIGQSTTLTGRSIARHMAAKVNEIVTGEYDHVGKSII
jgi:DNA polymerase elongation subunit (family B)